MTITVNSTSTDTCGFNGNRTIAHALAAGTNRVLVAMGAAGTAERVSSVTFNGTAMTRVRADLGVAISGNYIYVYAIPDALAAGSYNVVWTFTTADVAMEFRQIVFNGVDQTTISDDNKGASAGSVASAQSVTMTPSAGGMVVGICGGTNKTDPIVLGSGQTEIGAQTTLINHRAAGSYKDSATTFASSWVGGVRQFTTTAIALKAASAAGATIDLTGATTTQSATSGTGAATVTGPVAGTVNLIGSTTTQGATSGTGAATVAGAAGTLTTRVFKNNSRTPQAGLANCVLNIYNAATGALVLRSTGLTTNGAGRLVVTNAGLVAGTSYAYEADFSATSNGRRLPTAAAT